MGYDSDKNKSKSNDDDSNDNCPQADEARRNFAYHVPHFLTSQLDVINFFFSFFLFHIKRALVSQFQLILYKIIICPSLGGQRLMVAYLNHLAMVDDHDLVGILHRA